MKVFIDADVGFDFIGEHHPFFQHAAQIFELAQRGETDIVRDCIELFALVLSLPPETK